MLKVDQVVAGYGLLEVLHGISFDVPDRAIVALLGANGAGKTTLLRTLAGLIRTRSGAIMFDDAPIQRLPVERRVRLGMALVPEGRDLFGSLTVRENLLMGAYSRHARDAFEEDIERILGWFPRLKDRLGVPAASLSGGEGQMLAIGRALMSRPRIVLLDEPSHGLAPIIVEAVFDVIQRLNREEGLTILVVEQNAHKALSVATSAYVLQSGMVALAGSAQELTSRADVRELYLGG